MKTLRAAAILAMIVPTAGAARSDEAQAWRALQQGAVALFRHSNAPGTGDPPGIRLGDCATQRNLDAEGRAQARRIGEAFRSRAVPVGAVLSSAWCRTLETAELAFPGRARVEPAFNSFFANRSKGTGAVAEAKGVIAAWRGPGSLVVTTHQVNITGLTGIVPQPGEGVVIDVRNGDLRIVGRIMP